MRSEWVRGPSWLNASKPTALPAASKYIPELCNIKQFCNEMFCNVSWLTASELFTAEF